MNATRQEVLDSPPPLFLRDDPASLRDFRKMVLAYYRDHGRDLIFRRTRDPYRILVSEIMLQQTQVERVSVKYPAFIEAFPDFPSLAKAPLSDVLAAWQGMGYNRRAISLQECARRVVEEHDAILPQDPEILESFPGIGRATAASVCAFAFNMPVIFIETNIRRVFIHFFFSGDEPVHDTDILPLAKKALYRKNPRIWYWALMDLGSALKKTVPNPNRRSTHYARQSAFAGSDREIRGTIIRTLLLRPGQDMEELIQNTGDDKERVQRIIYSLEKEGFLTKTGKGVAIRSR
ncbi:MAG: A/G-specific adenine glycosylase [Methanoregulaceae archaeon]|nr:MAG: A/G-specific adenine glycosylase [Methanoregulaceae archaeon]